MTGNEIRKKYLDFYTSAPRNHKKISSAPLVPENDPTTLFTSSGMQPLVPYLMGEHHPEGTKLVNSQPSLRVQDIEEVGDNRHTTFFEMLGNWSLGDYFKTEQLEWVFDFLTNKEYGLSLNPQKLFVTVFEGNESVEKDYTSIGLWKEIFNSVGIEAEEGKRIFSYSAKKNWWSRSGTPEQMPSGEIGGPDSEIFYDFGEELNLHHNSPYKNEKCHPNCDCGRFLEIGNSVFIQYKKKDSGVLEELPQKNVDFGGGLERLIAATNNNPDIFETDLFLPLIRKVEEITKYKYESDFKISMRVIVDHIKASVFLVKNGVIPSNKLQGYVLRRLIRRSVIKARNLHVDINNSSLFTPIIEEVINIYKDVYFKGSELAEISSVISDEVSKFSKSLEKGLRELGKMEEITGKLAFDLYQTYGFPLELTIELLKENGKVINVTEFEEEFKKHQDTSRSAASGMFKGGLADQSPETTKLHTATHLLHKALRSVLGDHVQQKGSNITSERLRFDFTHNEKITEEQIKEIENLINLQIEKDLPVTFEVKSLSDAKKEGALAFFAEKYGDKVKVYTIGDPQKDWFSKEVCGGPHVSKLSEVGRVKIIKEEAVAAGVRRIYATAN